jgi:hypothetical protein
MLRDHLKDAIIDQILDGAYAPTTLGTRRRRAEAARP